MSKITVDLKNADNTNEKKVEQAAFLSGQTQPKKPGIFVKILKFSAVLLVIFIIIGTTGGFFYWRHLKQTPQYSLALLVEAARNGDQEKVDELVDTDAVVDDFLPQITEEAVELYGRNIPAQTIAKVAEVVQPVLPAIKERAKAEVPGLIRDKTEKLENFPFWAIAAGADQYLDIREEGDKAFIKSKLENRQLELTMQKSGDHWKVIAIKDEVLAQRIAEKIGQEVIAIATQKKSANGENELGIENLQSIIKGAEEIFK